MTTTRNAARATALVLFASYIASGCVQIDELVYEHENPEENIYEGAVDQSTNIESVSTGDIDADVAADVDTQVDNNTDVDASVAVGGSGDASPQNSVAADGFTLSYDWEGPLSETVTLTLTVGSATPAWDSVELLVAAPRFGPATPWDDPAGFEWGAPQATDPDEYTLASFFAPEDELTSFVWDMHTTWCDGDVCWPRAIEKACEADLVARIWLADGTEREARVHHDSPRVPCL